MTLKAKLITVLAIVIGLFAAVSITVLLNLRQTQTALDSAAKTTVTIAEAEIPFLLAIKEIKIDVIQVQQWLTDVSATQGMNGLDDGFETAAEYARKFESDVKAARRIANDLGLSAGLDLLDQIEKDFPPYYDTGRRMAESYVSSGPEMGNRIMRDFDATAERIGITTDQLVTFAEAHSRDRLAAMETQMLDIQDANGTLQALVTESQRHVTGTVRLKLYKGNVMVVGRRSPYSLYREDFATFGQDDVYNQEDAAGFINLFGLQMKVKAMMEVSDGGKTRYAAPDYSKFKRD